MRPSQDQLRELEETRKHAPQPRTLRLGQVSSQVSNVLHGHFSQAEQGFREILFLFLYSNGSNAYAALLRMTNYTVQVLRE